MQYPNFCEEKKLQKQGYKMIAGIDEAGRGPLAGPVVAAAVNFKLEILNLKSNKNFRLLNDSKKLTVKQREEIYDFLVNCPEVSWGVGIVSEKIIDKINILEATKLAMNKAISVLVKKNKSGKEFYDREKPYHNYFLLLDGNFTLDLDVMQKAIVKGDAKVFSIAAASIIAKVTRDRIMNKYHKKYPQYGFAQHKGYGTAAHFASIEKFGPCKIHRKTFYPVNKFVV